MTDIPYADKTWNPTKGCKWRSPGCSDCWALRSMARLAGKGDLAAWTAIIRTGESCSSLGRVAWSDAPPALIEKNLMQPLHWRKSRFIFVGAMSDLFDDRVPFEFIGRAFDTMAACPRHRFMILTKEPGRLAEFIDWYLTRMWRLSLAGFKNVILMVSVEAPDQMWRIDELLKIPAAIRGVSFEPLLEPVAYEVRDTIHKRRIDWVVIGCEKRAGGTAGRWAGSDPEAWWGAAAVMVEQCRNAGIAVWMKQGPTLGTRATGHGTRPKVTEDLQNFPENCRVQQKPEGLML